MQGARGPYSAVSRPPAPPARTLCLEPYRQPAASPSASGKCGGSGPSSLFCGAENSILSQWKANKQTNTQTASSSPRRGHRLLRSPVGPPTGGSAPRVCTPRFVYLRERIFFSTVKTLPALSPSIIGSLSFVLDARLCLFRHVANSHPAPLSRGASEHQAVPVPRPAPPHPGADGFLPPMQDFTKRCVERGRAPFLFGRSGLFMHTEYCNVTGFLLLLS